MSSCGVFAPQECKESRNLLLKQLKLLSKELDRGCCDECCVDSPFGRKPKIEYENPCVGMYPRANVPVPPNINPNRRARLANNTKTTLDGRPVSEKKEYELEDEFDRYPSPPWFRPRSKSQELRAGFFHIGCDCYKRNGLQDDCKRSECGMHECLLRPPECEASTFSPHTGVRIPNMLPNKYHNYNYNC